MSTSQKVSSCLAVASCRVLKLRALGKSVESCTRPVSSQATLARDSRQMHLARVYSRHKSFLEIESLQKVCGLLEVEIWRQMIFLWGMVKDYVFSQNSTFLADLEPLIMEVIRTIDWKIDVWRGVWRCTHAKLAPLTPHPLVWDRHNGPPLGQSTGRCLKRCF